MDQLEEFKFGPSLIKLGRRMTFSCRFLRPESEQRPLTAARVLILRSTNTLMGANHSQNTWGCPRILENGDTIVVFAQNCRN